MLLDVVSTYVVSVMILSMEILEYRTYYIKRHSIRVNTRQYVR